MSYLLGIAIISFIVIIVFKRKGEDESVISFENPLWIPAERNQADIRKEFFIKNKLLVSSEQALFYELKKDLPEGYYIFPNMRLADILTTAHGHGYYKRRNILLPKHIDFVIADSNFKPVLGIELNGSSHNNLKQQERDDLKREVFKSAGLPLVTVNVGQTYSEVVPKIIADYIQ